MKISPILLDRLRSKSTLETHQHLCELLARSRKVYYSRFGDGDVYILMGKSQKNHRFVESLRNELVESVSIDDPLYLKAMQVNSPEEKGMTKGLFQLWKYNNEHAKFLLDLLPSSNPIVFESAVFPSYFLSFKPVEMNDFLDRFVRSRKKLFIGSVPREEVERIFGPIDHYVQTPRKNAYAQIDSWWPEVARLADQVELVLPAVGMATRVVSKRLWNLGKEVHCLDLGSIVDAVSSFPSSRSWIRLKRHMANQVLLPEFRDNSLSYRVHCFWRESMLRIRKIFYDIDPFSRVPFIRKARRYHPGGPGKNFD